MRVLAFAVFMALSVAPAFAIDLRLEESWLPKLGALCEAARYGSRMTADPICNDLAMLVQQQSAADASAKAKAAADAAKAKESEPNK